MRQDTLYSIDHNYLTQQLKSHSKVKAFPSDYCCFHTHNPLIKSRHERAPFIFHLRFCASSMVYNGEVICHIEHRHCTNIGRNRVKWFVLAIPRSSPLCAVVNIDAWRDGENRFSSKRAPVSDERYSRYLYESIIIANSSGVFILLTC